MCSGRYWAIATGDLTGDGNVVQCNSIGVVFDTASSHTCVSSPAAGARNDDSDSDNDHVTY